MNAADNAWVLAASALVLLMTPGLAMFYGGMTRSKNVLSTMMHSFFLMGLASIIWLFLRLQSGFCSRCLRRIHRWDGLFRSERYRCGSVP